MNCSQFRFKISLDLDRELSFAEQKIFSQHDEECSDCAELLAEIKKMKLALKQGIAVSISPDFLSRLQERLRSEVDRKPVWWRRLTVPQRFGFSPVSLGGMVAAALAVLVLGVSLFQHESAPLVDPPQSAVQTGQPAMPTPNVQAVNPAFTPLLTTLPADTISNRRDSSQRDFSRRIKFVNQSK